MPGVLDGAIRAPRRHERVVRSAREGPVRPRSARDRHGVPALGPALGDHEIPVIADLVEVRRLGEHAARTRPQALLLRERLARRRIELDLGDALVDQSVRLLIEEEAGHRDVTGALLVPDDVGINAEHVHDDAVRPGARRILGREEDVPAPRPHHVGDDEVEEAVMMADRRRPDTSAGRHALHAGLAVADDDMSEEFEVLHAPRVADRNAREVFEGRAHEVVVLADAADARVGVESGDQGVHIGLLRRHRRHRRTGRGRARHHAADLTIGASEANTLINQSVIKGMKRE